MRRVLNFNEATIAQFERYVVGDPITVSGRFNRRRPIDLKVLPLDRILAEIRLKLIEQEARTR